MKTSYFSGGLGWSEKKGKEMCETAPGKRLPSLECKEVGEGALLALGALLSCLNSGSVKLLGMSFK